MLALLTVSVLFGLLLWRAGEIYAEQDTFDGARLPEVDAIVVLAGARGRLAQASDIWFRYFETQPQKLPVLFLSGLGPKVGQTALATQIRRGVLAELFDQDVPTSRVVLETESQNTEENALYFSHYAVSRGWKKILLVTSPYHMRRARFIFENTLVRDGVSIQIETASTASEFFERGNWRESILGIELTISEYLKWLAYQWTWGSDPKLAR
jgi:uncharacterized SAM-binding protein YcdF (DUF218 family)